MKTSRLLSLSLALLMALSLCACQTAKPSAAPSSSAATAASSQGAPVSQSAPAASKSASTAAASQSVPAAKREGKTVILHTNDSHGRIAASDSIIGMSALSALRESYEKQGMNVILLDAGDTLHGTSIATLDKGKSVLEIMAMAGYNAMVPGNHDFNYTCDYLISLAKNSKFPIISANLVDKTSGSPLLDDSVIIEQNGMKTGIFGLCTTYTAYSTNPANIPNAAFSDPVEAAKAEVAKLKEGGADYIVALCHMGMDLGDQLSSVELAKQVEGIDLIVDGHSHTTLENGKKSGDTLIVSTGEYMGAIGVVTVDNATLDAKAELIKAGDERLKGLSDPAIDKKLSEVAKAQETILSEVLAASPVDLDGEREHVRTRETNLGNLIADSMRKYANADIAVINGGGIRASIEKGEVTKGDILTVMPFGNYAVTKRVTGMQLHEMLEHSVAALPDQAGCFLHVSGITFNYDADLPAGSRVCDIYFNSQPIVAAQEYLLVTNDYIASGGDGYTLMADLPIQNELSAIDEIVIAYINGLDGGWSRYLAAEGRINQFTAASSKAA